MADEVKDLKSTLDRLALDNRRDQRDVARAVGSAADTLRGRLLEALPPDKVEELDRFLELLIGRLDSGLPGQAG